MPIFDDNEIPQEPRARYFVKRGECVIVERGFASKKHALMWIRALAEAHRLDWSVGFQFRLRGDGFDSDIVDKAGKRPVLKPADYLR